MSSRTAQTTGQIDLFAWADELEEEHARVADINAERAEGRRLRAYLAPGRYRDELADARWVA
jgi:hypothetical protein